ncbi:hypothetical protein SK128_018808 [Halocaridina rubra]|uniref:Uncharacterized protein n=1 Tax=Halocaridina rubra TaxID=373956 RepID=A0AAN9A8V7_HALRR
MRCNQLILCKQNFLRNFVGVWVGVKCIAEAYDTDFAVMKFGLSRLLKYVMTVGQNFRHWSSMSAQAMLIIPSPTVTKLGIASTFILGAAIGNKVKKLWKEQPHHGTSEERRNYLTTTAKPSENITTPKECDTVNRLLSILQNVSINLPDQNHATKYYIDKASILCTNYLCSRGVRELSVDDILGNWIEDSDWIDNTDHWLKLPSLRQYERPSYSSALLAGVKAVWHLSRFENFCLEGCKFIMIWDLQVLHTS